MTSLSTADGLTRFYGKYRGTVTKVDDPDHMGRIRAKVPEVLGDVETGWALPCLPLAGNGIGLFAVPEAESGVWIEFEAGDVSRPVYSGGFWAKNQRPKGAGGTAAPPTMRVLRSAKGLMVCLDDENQKISVGDADGKNLLEIDVNGGKATLKSSTKVVVEAPAIEIVQNAAHSAVFGDELLNYLSQLASTLNSHTHPGQVAGPYPVSPTPPTPQATTPQNSMLSSKVKVG